MGTHAASRSYIVDWSPYPIDVRVHDRLTERDRLTVAFRPLLAIPHILFIGGPIGFALPFLWDNETGRVNWGFGTGVLGAVAAVSAFIAWFAIIFTGTHPEGLRSLATFYLRWRVRAVAYFTLLRDDYPPFGDDDYPVTLASNPPVGARHRLSVAFRVFLAIPHLIVISVLGTVWCVTTFIAWLNILFTRRFPAPLYHFGVGMLRWTTRVEAYLLLLSDDYPPFGFD